MSFSIFNIFSNCPFLPVPTPIQAEENSKLSAPRVSQLCSVPIPHTAVRTQKGIRSSASPLLTQKGQEFWLAPHPADLLLPAEDSWREPQAACDSGRHILTCLTPEHCCCTQQKARSYQPATRVTQSAHVVWCGVAWSSHISVCVKTEPPSLLCGPGHEI